VLGAGGGEGRERGSAYVLDLDVNRPGVKVKVSDQGVRPTVVEGGPIGVRVRGQGLGAAAGI